MSSASEPWVAQAWSHWHRPWAVTHASWMAPPVDDLSAQPAHELALRMHYPAWCRQYALEPTLHDFADTPWWRLVALPQFEFEQAATRVGLALMYAANHRLKLLRGAQPEVALVRWALERAPFVLPAVAKAIHEAVPGGTPMQHAAMSLRGCLPAASDLWGRLRLRFACDQVPEEGHAPIAMDAGAQAHMSRLWRTAIRVPAAIHPEAS